MNLVVGLVAASLLFVLFISRGDGNTSDTCMHGDVRLVDGPNKFNGRVEICDEGEWNSVCDHGWNQNEAIVVCRQLGYDQRSIVNATNIKRGCAGQGSGNISKTVWNCTGNEAALLNCSSRIRTGVQCDHSRDAGVYCSGMTVHGCVGGSLRLVNGSSSASGRVEVCRRGCWGTVCDDTWDRNDAAVVCRQLGFGTLEAIPTRRAYFGEGSGPIHLSQARCESDNITRLINCEIDKDGINNCSHSEDAGVICETEVTDAPNSSNTEVMEEATKTLSTVQQQVPVILGSVCGLVALATAFVTILMIIVLAKTRKSSTLGDPPCTETEHGACQFTCDDTSLTKPPSNGVRDEQQVLDNPIYSTAQVNSSNQSEACTPGEPTRVESYSTTTGIEQGQHRLDEAIVMNQPNDEDECQFDNPIYDVQVKSSMQ